MYNAHLPNLMQWHILQTLFNFLHIANISIYYILFLSFHYSSYTGRDDDEQGRQRCLAIHLCRLDCPRYILITLYQLTIRMFLLTVLVILKIISNCKCF